MNMKVEMKVEMVEMSKKSTCGVDVSLGILQTISS